METARTPLRGQLASISVAEVLRSVEASATTGRVQFETDIGPAEVWFNRGSLVDARMGGLRAAAALHRLLGATDGSFRVLTEPVVVSRALVESISSLLSDRSRRLTEWRKLSELAPAFDSVLRTTQEGVRALDREPAESPRRRVLSLADGRLAIAELIDESGLDPVDALAAIIDALREHLLVELDPAHSPFPPGDPPTESHEIALPAAPRLPRLDAKPRFDGRATFMGLGADEHAKHLLQAQPKSERNALKSAPKSQRGFEPVPVSKLRPLPLISVNPSSGARPDEGRDASGSADAPPAVQPVELAPPAPTAPLPPAAGPTPDAAAAARFVGRYEVLCRIGRGGMGSVYLCRLSSQGGFRRLFALKLLRSHLSNSSKAADAFLEEARLAGQIHHPNVVAVVDAGLHGSQPYLVMDYVEGCSLKQLMTSPGGASPARVLTVVMDALAGLHAAHTLVGDDGERLNLVHCDVSPENLLVGVDGVCRLTDFGIARLTTEGSVSDRATHGKPGYLAPEQVTGGRVDSRADVFAMGIVLWNALTGQQLFAARTAQEQMRLVLSARISPPSAVGARPTPALDFVCMKALERDPDRRFGSADEMLTELRRIAMREELLAPSGDVAAWVREAFGRELAQRRLTVLDAARRASSPPVAESSEASAEPPRSIPSSNPPSPASAGHELSRTIVLPEVGGRGRRLLILSASAVAAIAILLTLLFPNQVSKLFRASKPAGVVAPPPEAAAPEPAKSAPNLEPIVTPVPHTTLEAREPAPAPEAPPRAVRHPISRPPPATSARQAPDPGASAEEPRAASPTPEPTAAPSAAFPGVEP